jgi:ribosomal protein L19
MIYFIKRLTNNLKNNLKKKRKFIFNNPLNGEFFNRGDIITINFWNKTFNYNFEGICIFLKKTKFKTNKTMLLLKNIINNISVEIIISYYNYRLFNNTLMSDYKRKKYKYKSSKLYFLSYKKNQATKI